MDEARQPNENGSARERRWAIVEDLFNAALGLEPERRDTFIRRNTGGDRALGDEIRGLLNAHERASDAFLSTLDLDRAAALLESDDCALRPGERIGSYVIERELARGGMGVVYLAKRGDDQFEQRVALKVVRDGVATASLLRRFFRERRILARLQHPNIASLLDGGMIDDGRPFLAMEYVEGSPITKYCDGRRAGVEERLRLFMDACTAVQSAHQRLVIHRDLKPANILVSADGRVKLLDFGIAKLLDPDTDEGAATPTEAGLRALTPEYAAPEQVRGEQVTTATDVYSLGVVLYELLSGHRPHRFESRKLEAVARVLREEVPAAPSVAAGRAESSRAPHAATDALTPERVATERDTTPERLRRRLTGDLDAIALTALRYEPGQRYGSAQALREDIHRHLSRVPISARRDTLAYRTGRFVRRNRAAVGATALALVSLIGGLAATAWQAREATRQRDLALREADKAARVSAFVTELFRLADPARSRGEQLTVRETLDTGRVWIERELAAQPELRVDMAHQLGEIYFRLGLYDEARKLWESAVLTGIAHYGETNETVLYTMLDLVKALENLGRGDSAEVLARRSLTIFRGLPELRDRDFAATNVLHRLGNTLRLRGRLADAEPLLVEALETLPPNHREAAERRTVISTTLAHVRRARGDAAGAEALYREVLATRLAVWGEEHPEVANALVNLAGALSDQRRYPEAEMRFRDGLEMRRKLQGETHPDFALDLGAFAELKRRAGDLDSAARLYSQALKLQRQAFPQRHFRLVGTLLGLAEVLLQQGRVEGAEPLLREAVATGTIALGANHHQVAEARSALGYSLTRLGRWKEAEAHLVAGYESLAASLGHDASATRLARERLAAHGERMRGRGVSAHQR